MSPFVIYSIASSFSSHYIHGSSKKNEKNIYAHVTRGIVQGFLIRHLLCILSFSGARVRSNERTNSLLKHGLMMICDYGDDIMTCTIDLEIYNSQS